MPQYQGVWTLQQQAQAQSNQQWVTDPNFKNTTLLLQADGTGSGSQNQTFLDGSTNNFFITRNGNTTQGSFSPFSQAPGYWSSYFNRYALSIASVTAAGTGDFTYEGWIYPTVFDTLLNIWDHRSGTGHTSGMYFAVNSTGNILIYNVTPSTNAVLLNQWNHVAFVRSSGTLTYYINGVSGGSQSFTRNCTDTPFYIANGNDNPTSVSGFIGYISNMRYATSVVYTSNFNPNTSPLGITSGGQVPPTGTNTKVLGCQFNRFSYTDSAGAVQSFTVSGTPSVQAFGPFAPALQWTSDVVGGSGYFDGTGDYLSISSVSSFNLGTNDFTLEVWWYPTAFSADGEIFHCYNGAFSFYNSSTGGQVDGYIGTGAGSWNIMNIGNIGVAKLNSWNHIAITRSGSTFRTFLNGVAGATATSSSSITTTNCFVGARTGGAGVVGSCYITNCRVLSGTALYTSAFTPPTAPLTAVSGTTFLLSCTNAGIYDGKMANNLETVGSAQVATSPVKYGSGSMYFDGNGDYLIKPTSPLFVIGTGDFTIECWYYKQANGVNGYDGIICTSTDGNATGGYYVELSSTRGFYFRVGSNTYTNTTTTYINDSTWHHFALSRFGSSLKFFIDGVSQTLSSSTSTDNMLANGNIVIGATVNASNVPTYFFNGYIDDLRVTRACRYFANFTPPQQALPRQ